MKIVFMAAPAASTSMIWQSRTKWRVNMPGQFQGKVVVITGGSRGIGRGIAVAFAREGAQTVIASSSASNLDAASKVIAQVGPEPLAVAGDLRRLADCEQLFAKVKEAFGRCNIL